METDEGEQGSMNVADRGAPQVPSDIRTTSRAERLRD